MTKIIAIGKKGKNIVFEKKQEALEFFCLTWAELNTRINNGKPAEDPSTGNKYYLDELVDIDTEPEEPKCYTKKCDDWEDWD